MENTQIFLILFISMFVLFIFFVSFTISYLDEKKKLSHRIDTVMNHHNHFLVETENFSVFKKTQESLLEKKISQYLRHRPQTENAVRLKLYRAGMSGHLGRLFIGMALTSTVLVMIISNVGTFNHGYDIPLGIILAISLTYLALNFLENRFRKKVTEQLPLAIDIILRGIKSGSSVEKTFTIVVKEIGMPLKEEFSRIIQKIEFGVSFDNALHEAADRVGLSDFYFFSTALIIQRKGGGSLSEILENIIISLNRSNEIRAKIKVFSAEAKVTAYILGSLPIVIWGVMMQFNPTYLDFFRFEEMGHKMLMIAGGLIACAGVMIKQLMKIKV